MEILDLNNQSKYCNMVACVTSRCNHPKAVDEIFMLDIIAMKAGRL